MSQKFSIVVEVSKDGKPIATAYIKPEAKLASDHFVRLRDSGKEAYLFQHPLADRRNKSIEQVAATRGERDENGLATSTAVADNPLPSPAANNTISSPAPKKRKGNSIEGVTLNIDADGPTAVNM
jgi:hypothetical protein